MKRLALQWLIPAIIWTLFLPFSISQTSNQDAIKSSIFTKIASDSIKHIIIAADFDLLMQGRFEKDWPKQKATITLKNDTAKWQLPVNLELRGRFRRKICELPPIKLDFPKKALVGIGLDSTFDELKLVTNCLNTEEGQQVLFKEYWTYRLQNLLTPNSFKVHLVKVTYLNTSDPNATVEQMGFLIENNKELAHRLGGKMVSRFGMTPKELELNSYHHALMFNYLIGNLDWNILVQRNVKYIEKGEKLIVVPYDFDHAALVKAPYAKPHPDYKQERLEDRYCIGKFSDKATLDEMANAYQDKEDKLLLFKSCPYLDNKHKLRMEAYINSFFEEIRDEKSLKKAFLSKNR